MKLLKDFKEAWPLLLGLVAVISAFTALQVQSRENTADILSLQKEMPPLSEVQGLHQDIIDVRADMRQLRNELRYSRQTSR